MLKEFWNNYSGFIVLGIITLPFIVLKLLKIIDISWFWVLTPFWISMGAVLFTMLVLFIAVWIIERNQQ